MKKSLKLIKELKGVLSKYAEGKPDDWQTLLETAMNNEFEENTDKKLTNDDTIDRVEKFNLLV